MNDSKKYSQHIRLLIISITIQIAIQINTTAQVVQQYTQFDQITNSSGRTLGFITGITQDSTGFLWIATRDGLYRYDGYSFLFFNNNNRSANQLPFNGVTHFYYDRNKTFWLRNFDNYLLFDGTKPILPFDTTISQRFDHNTKVEHDIDGNYWITPHGRNTYRLNPQTHQIDTFVCDVNALHPQITSFIENNRIFTANLQLSPVNFNTDTLVEFQNNKAEYFLVATAGEGNRISLFDYATIEQNEKVIWKPDLSKADFSSSQPLFYTCIDFLYLPAGRYTIRYRSDEANNFSAETLTCFQQSLYGIKLISLENDNNIRKLREQPYMHSNGIYGRSVSDITLNNSGYPLITTERAVLEYNKKENSFEILAQLEQPQRRNSFVPVCQMADGTLLYAESNSLIIQKNKKKQKIELPAETTVLCITTVRKNQIWLGTNTGLFILNPQFAINSNNPAHITATTENRLYSNAVWSIFEDNSHNVWIGTDKGLSRFRQSKFEHIDIDDGKFTPRPFIVNRSGEIKLLSNRGFWTTIKNNNMEQTSANKTIFDIDTDTQKPKFEINDLTQFGNKIVFTSSNKIGLKGDDSDIIKAIETPALETGDQNIATKILVTDNRLWVALVDRILVLNENLQIIKEIFHPQTVESRYEISSTFVSHLIKCSQNTVGIRTEKDIYLINTNNFTISKTYQIPEYYYGTTSAHGNLITTADSAIWFAVFPRIVKITPDLTICEVELDIKDDIGNSNLYITDSVLWIYTNNGLIKIDHYQSLMRDSTLLTNEKYEIYTTREGLADNSITGILSDKNENLWITTLKGLTCLNTKTRETQNYFRDIDPLSLNFTGNIIFADHTPTKYRQVILQTSTGLLLFNPDSVNTYVPKTVIDEILLFGKPIITDTVIWEKQYLKLPFNENFLTIRFSALDYTQPAQNKYRYRLLNFNDEWTYTDALNRQAPYTGLPPGKYVFTVQGTNNDGVWNNVGQSLIIEITPPWYRTILAYILYIIATIVIVTGYIKLRERKLKEEKRILEIKVQERTIEIQKQKDEIEQQRDHIAEQNQDITASIQYASRIQAALLPSEENIKNMLPSYFVLWRPRDIVSGDFYWVAQKKELTIATAADCTGHGVPGAFMSMLGVAFLNELVGKENITKSQKILNSLRAYIIKSLKQTDEAGRSKDGMDMSLCVINHKTMQAEFSGANNPLYIVRKGELIEYKADKMPIGYYHFADDREFTEHIIDLYKGDRLYMFSDGYVDQFGGESGKKFMSRNFKQLLVESATMSMESQKIMLNTRIEEWIGKGEQIDDILVFGIEITGNYLKD